MLTRRVRPWLMPPVPGETPAQTSARRDEAYFAEQLSDNDEWLRRMARRTCVQTLLDALVAVEGEVLGAVLNRSAPFRRSASGSIDG